MTGNITLCIGKSFGTFASASMRREKYLTSTALLSARICSQITTQDNKMQVPRITFYVRRRTIDAKAERAQRLRSIINKGKPTQKLAKVGHSLCAMRCRSAPRPFLVRVSVLLACCDVVVFTRSTIAALTDLQSQPLSPAGVVARPEREAQVEGLKAPDEESLVARKWLPSMQCLPIRWRAGKEAPTRRA